MSSLDAKRNGADEFATFVDDLAAKLVEHSPTFEAFVVAMPGVLPDEALAALRRIPGPHAANLIADAGVDRRAVGGRDGVLGVGARVAVAAAGGGHVALRG